MDKNIAIIGCGYWGKNLVRCFYEIGALKGIFDLDFSRSSQMQLKFPDVYIYSDVSELLSDPDIQGVVVAVPVEYHFDVAMNVLSSGKDVFIEKPMAMSYEQCQILSKIIERDKRVCLVGHILEYHPAIRKLRELIKTGQIGAIKEIYSHRLNTGKIRQTENVWWSFAPHDILLLCNTVNSSIKNINCFLSDYFNRGVADSTITTFKFNNGVFGHIYVSWLHPFKCQSFVVIGTEKTIEFTDSKTKDKLLLYHHRYHMNNEKEAVLIKGDFEVVPYEENEPLKLECLDFIECIKNRSLPRSSHKDGTCVVKILEESMTKGTI